MPGNHKNIFLGHTVVILLLLFINSTGFAYETQEFDSKIKNASGKEKIELLIKAGDSYRTVNPSKAIDYSQKALELSREMGDEELIIKSEMTLASCYKQINDYQNAIKTYEKALTTSGEINKKSMSAHLMIDLSDIYTLMSNYEKALAYSLKALQIYKEIKNDKGLAESYHNIAIIYYYILNFDKARQYNFQALETFKRTFDTSGIAKSLSNIAMIYTGLDSLEKAMEYNFKALDLMKQIKNEEGTANAYTNIGINYYHQKRYAEALDYLNKALEIFNQTAYLRNRTLVLAYIGYIYFEQNDNTQALHYANESHELAKNSNTIDLLATIYTLYSDIYLKTGDYQNAYKFKEAFTSIKDSIFNESSKNKISELEVRIEDENKAKEENELLKMKNKMQLILFISIFLLIMIIAFVIFSRYRTKQKANLLLEEKNQMISKQNTSLEILNKELNEANAAKDKFFSIMAHDLKSPLWWFKNVTDLLSNKFDQLSKEKIMEITKVLDDSAQTSLHLIENLLQWSRSQSGRIEFIPETINLSHVFNHIMAHHKLHAESKKIKVVTNFTEDARLEADKNMIYSILRNILSNAIKFSNEGGTIYVDFQEKPDYCEISVKDSGIGIDPKDIDNIFRIDIQTTTLGTSQEKGTGLGLIITKEFVQKHGGTMKIESKPNEGAKISFTIPKK